jgi:hypothetical protein
VIQAGSEDDREEKNNFRNNKKAKKTFGVSTKGTYILATAWKSGILEKIVSSSDNFVLKWFFYSRIL